MFRQIDNFLNSITMYRLVLYGLFGIAILSIVFGFLGVLPYTGLGYVGSLLIVCTSAYGANYIFSRLYKAPTNSESALITGLILFFILPPATRISDLGIFFLAGIIAMASKYILARGTKHIFNPAAAAATILFFTGITGADWWIGSLVMTPAVLIFGLLIVRKIRKFSMFFTFVTSSLVVMLTLGFINKVGLADLLTQAFTSWPLIFLGTVMLTEPLTTPPTRRHQMMYGGLVGGLFASQFHIGPVFSTPELALVVGNIFSYIVSPKDKLMLKFKQKLKVGSTVYEFIFESNKKLRFKAGQYLEWTLPHVHVDGRGNRRYFTIASAPTEDEVRLGVKVFDVSSSFKRALSAMQVGDPIAASQLSGEFTLPKNKKEKIVLIAGGIGVTPYRSMIKYLIDKGEKRDIVLLYACSSADDFAYKDLFDEATRKIGLKVVYIITNSKNVPQGWHGATGYIDASMLREYIEDYTSRKFYLSGPQKMVTSYYDTLIKMGLNRSNIVTDYFPGF